MSRAVKQRSFVMPVFIIIFLMVAGVLAAALFLEFTKQGREPVYRYVSMSEEAAAKAYIWLNRIDDMPLSYQEIKGMMGDIRLRIVLTPTGEKGKYTQALSDGTYEEYRDQARRGLETAYREVVRYRALAAGYEEELSDEMLDDMMREAYGVSVAEYLSSCDLRLLPDPEELTEMYSGEVADGSF